MESLVFCVMQKEMGRETLIVHGRTRRLRTGKRAKVMGNLLHVSGYWGANTIHTKPLNMWLVEQRAKHCSKNSVLFDYIMVMREKYQTLPAYISFRSGVGEPGNEAKYSEGLGDFSHAAIPGEKR